LTRPAADASIDAMPATHEDAMLMVELAKWNAMIGGNEAAGKIFSEAFDRDKASVDDAEVRTTLYFYETIGTLVKNDLLDRGLVYDWLWVRGAWEAVGPAALRDREARGVAALFENFEALAAGQ
jgi:hypothetical protein